MAIFNSTKEKTTQQPNTPSNKQNIIAFGTSISGNIECNGPLRIDGELIGNIKSVNKIIVGKTGKIEGEIEAKSIDVEGVFDGKIVAQEALHIKSTAKVTGEILSKSLAIEEGASFNAMSKTTREALKKAGNTTKSKPVVTDLKEPA